MTGPSPRLVRRYGPAQRTIHWVGVASFLLLLASGSALAIPGLAIFAAGGLSGFVHRAAAIPFLLLPAAYAILLPREARELLSESFRWGRADREWLARLPGYFLGRTRGLPPQGRLNAGQKLHHAGTFLAFATAAASGLLLWLAKGHLGPAGLVAAAVGHDLSVLALSLLLVGHVYFTFLYDAFSAMRTGEVTEEYARMEHRLWLESLPPEAAGGAGTGEAAPPPGGPGGIG